MPNLAECLIECGFRIHRGRMSRDLLRSNTPVARAKQQHELENTMTDPKSLPESDPRRHTIQVRKALTDLAHHLREDIEKVDDPSFKTLFDTTASVLTGLDAAVAAYEAKL